MRGGASGGRSSSGSSDGGVAWVDLPLADVRIGVDRIPRRGVGGEELDDAVDVSGGMAGQIGLDG